MRVVLDTNIIVSAFLSPSGAPAQILSYLEQDAFSLLVSSALLEEYERALNYANVRALHGMSRAEITAAMDDLAAAAVMVEPTEPLDVVQQDVTDNRLFECAAAGAAAYIVSGDAHVQAVGVFRGIRVVAPALFVTVLAKDIA